VIDVITGFRARSCVADARARACVCMCMCARVTYKLSMHMVHIAWTLADFRPPRDVSLSTSKEGSGRLGGGYVLLTYHSISISASLVTNDCSDKSLVPAAPLRVLNR